jgi:hypothetical protein
MSGTLLTGEKKIRDIMTSLLLSERAYILNLLPWWTGGAFLQRMLKGDSPGDSPAPNRDPALFAKVTTGSLSATVPKWKKR